MIQIGIKNEVIPEQFQCRTCSFAVVVRIFDPGCDLTDIDRARMGKLRRVHCRFRRPVAEYVIEFVVGADTEFDLLIFFKRSEIVFVVFQHDHDSVAAIDTVFQFIGSCTAVFAPFEADGTAIRSGFRFDDFRSGIFIGFLTAAYIDEKSFLGIKTAGDGKTAERGGFSDSDAVYLILIRKGDDTV